MADSTLTQGLKEKLTCKLCRGVYRNPKMLPCFHSFCFDCLKELQRQTKLFEKLLCPICHYGTHLVDTIALQSLPSPYFVSCLQKVLDCGQEELELTCSSCDRHTLATSFCFDCKCLVCQDCIQVHEQMKAMRCHRIIELEDIHSKDMRELVKGMRTCSQKSHQSEAMAFFCRDCGKCVCDKCQTGSHHLHRLSRIKDAKLESDFEVSDYIANLDVKISTCESVIQKIEANYNRAVQKIVTVRTNVRDKVNTLIRVLRNHEKRMISQLERIQLDLRQDILSQKRDYEGQLIQMVETKDFVGDIMDRDIDIEVLNLHNSLIQRLTELLSVPIEQGKHKTVNIDYDHNHGFLPVLENVYLGQVKMSFTDPLCSEVVSENFDQSITSTGKRLVFEAVTKDSEGNRSYSDDDRLAVRVESEKGFTIKTLIEDMKDGNYRIGFTPLKPDVLFVHVTVMGEPIQGSPFQIYVKSRTEYLRESLMSDSSTSSAGSGESDVLKPIKILGLSRGHFGRPCGIAMNDDDVIAVADSRNKTVHVLGLDGEVLRNLGENGNSNVLLPNPVGVAFDYDSNVLVTDCDSHVVKVFDPAGQCIRKFGSRDLERPLGICCSSDGSSFVCDSGARSVKKFSSKGAFLGEFKSPDVHTSGRRVAPYFITQHGYKYFVTFDNHSVQVFDDGGSFLYKIGDKGHGDGRFKDPRGVAVDSRDRLFVCDAGNHRIQVFSVDGRISLFGCYGAQLGQFDKPQDITVTRNGIAIVSDFNNGRIQLFGQD